MRTLIVTAGAITLTGCTLNMAHPSATQEQQKQDRAACADKAADSSVKECMLDKGYTLISRLAEDW